MAGAQSQFSVAAGYAKGNDKFDIVAKEVPNTKLKVYVDDKNAVTATANKKGWVTFRGVKLTGNYGKLSFTQVKTVDGKTRERPLNYVRNFSLETTKITFIVPKVAATPAPVAAPATPEPAPAPAPAPTPAPAATPTPSSSSNLSNNNTYTNSAGNTVHSPASTTDGSIPEGATARCGDGTYSFSQSRSGTCSHHGGVASWL